MMFKKVKSMFKGYLTSRDIVKLEKAAVRPLKHKKVFVKQWLCSACDYVWFYNSLRCPSCSSAEIKKQK